MDLSKEQKGSVKRLFSLLKNVKIPWHLYVLEFIMGIVSTKVALLLVPSQAAIETGDISNFGIVYEYLGMTLLATVVGMLANIPTFYAKSIMTRNMQDKMIGKAVRLKTKTYEKNASQMVSWITTDTESADGVIAAIVGFFSGVATVGMTFSDMTKVDMKLAYILPAVIIFVLFATWLSGKLQFLRQRKNSGAQSELTAYFAEHLSFALQIKQLHGEKNEARIGKRAIDRMYKADIYQAILIFIDSGISGSAQTIITILVFALGVPIVRRGDIHMAELAAFQSYILISYQSIMSLTSLYTSIMYYNGQLFYAARFMKGEEEEYNQAKTMDVKDADIVFENVDFSYNQDEKKVLENVSFIIPKGKITAIVGRNGAGKSTLFKLIERFYEPTSGKILFGNESISQFNLGEWRKSMCYIIQDPMLFNGTVFENIVYGLDRNVEIDEVEKVVKMINAQECINNLPEKYDTIVGENGNFLSAGQKQTICIIRALLLDPDYLLLDEATCNLDVRTKESVLEALFKFMKGKTMVYITHDKKLVERADNVVRIGRN